MLKDLLFKCHTVSDYLQREDIDIVGALQVVDITVKTIRDMRHETKFKDYYDKAVDLAREKDEPRRRKISRRIDENWQMNTLHHIKKAYMLVSIMRYWILF